MIKVDDYPQLAFICWSQPGRGLIEEEQALALYERNWGWVDTSALTINERDLIARLSADHGNGVLLV